MVWEEKFEEVAKRGEREKKIRVLSASSHGPQAHLPATATIGLIGSSHPATLTLPTVGWRVAFCVAGNTRMQVCIHVPTLQSCSAKR
jgi:hypothetical protein